MCAMIFQASLMNEHPSKYLSQRVVSVEGIEEDPLVCSYENYQTSWYEMHLLLDAKCPQKVLFLFLEVMAYHYSSPHGGHSPMVKTHQAYLPPLVLLVRKYLQVHRWVS